MSVGDENIPSEGLPLGLKVTETGDILGRSVDLLAVPVGHRDHVVHLVVSREQGGLPDLAFLGLAVSAENVDTVRVIVGLLRESRSDRHGKSLPEGTGGLEHSRQALSYGRVSLEPGPELAERLQLGDREVPGSCQD